MSPSGRDIEIPSAPEEPDPPLSLLMGIDLEEIYQSFSELAFLTGFQTVESPLVSRKVERVVSWLLALDMPASLVETVEQAAVVSGSATARHEDRLAVLPEVERGLDQVMRRVREHLPERDRPWYDVGVMMARTAMCQSMVTAIEAHFTEARKLSDVYRRELARAIPITTGMLRKVLDDTEGLLGTHTRTALEKLFTVLVDEASVPSDRLGTALDAVFTSLGIAAIPFARPPASPAESPDRTQALTAKRAAAFTLLQDGRLDEADQLYGELLRELRAALGMAHHDCLQVQLDRCWVQAGLGQLRSAVDTAYDAAVSVAFTHGPDDPDAVAIQVRSLQFLLTQGETADAELIRKEYLSWLEEAGSAELSPPLRTAKADLADVLGHAAKMDRVLEVTRHLGDIDELRGRARTAALTRLHDACDREFGAAEAITLRVAFELAEALIDNGKLRRATKVAERAVRANDELRGPDEPASVLTYVRAWWVYMRSTRFGPQLIEMIRRVHWLGNADYSELHGELREAYDWYHSVNRIMDEL